MECTWSVERVGDDICAGVVGHGHGDFAEGFEGERRERALHPGDWGFGANVGGLSAVSCEDEGVGMAVHKS